MNHGLRTFVLLVAGVVAGACADSGRATSHLEAENQALRRDADRLREDLDVQRAESERLRRELAAERAATATLPVAPPALRTDVPVPIPPAPRANAPQPAPSERLAVSAQCGGTTQKGARCKRMTKSPNGLCYQHGGN